MSIATNLKHIKATLPKHVELIAVSKTKPIPLLLEAYEAGQRIFGENKIQEMTGKWEKMPKDIQWHMIGHVQTNKVKYMAPYVSLIHGVDSLKLLKEINKRAAANNRTISCLLQMHIAEEETKFGLDKNELFDLLKAPELAAMKNIKLAGLMGMATFTNDNHQIEKEFNFLKLVFEEVKKLFNDLPQLQFQVLSMGMSGDYKIAINCGSNMVRIGSSIFGARN